MSERPPVEGREVAAEHVGGCNPACVGGEHFLQGKRPRMVVTDCCGRLLPEPQTLVGDVHFPDLCAGCSWLDGREHERHITCDWTRGVECPGRDWSYVDGRVTRPGFPVVPGPPTDGES